ncbi:MAG: M28 family peptidase [Bacteroidales bacterium]|jgi:hypothetical protein|nr:M28 family peptidase [Bacteroidales bacterium]
MKKNAFVFLTILMVINQLFSQDSLQTKRWICQLASPEFYGRGCSHYGDSIAAQYIKEELIRLDLKPFFKNNYFQKYQFPAFAMEGKVALAVNHQLLNPFDDYRIAPFSNAISSKKISLLTLDPTCLFNMDLLRDFTTKNRKILPNSFIYIDVANFNPENAKEKEFLNQLIRDCQHLPQNPFGAMGIIAGVKELPAWSPGRTTFERNFSFIYVIADKMPKKPSKIALNLTNTFHLHRTQNIIAVIKGTQYPDSFILLTAHYDHIGSMGDEVIFTGAHDNASGTATVLSLAAYIRQHPLPYTTLFCFFSGEEAGLMGSTYFASNPIIDFSKIKFALNIDMACGGDEGIMVVNSQDEKTKWFYGKLVTLNEQEHFLPAVKNRPNAANSDHYPLSQQGIPALFIYTMGGKTGGYHNYTDRCENCSLAQWEKFFGLIVGALQQIGNK